MSDKTMPISTDWHRTPTSTVMSVSRSLPRLIRNASDSRAALRHVPDVPSIEIVVVSFTSVNED